jgi:alkylation response protein AidB-like acyl-CoA dehydrogenase
VLVPVSREERHHELREEVRQFLEEELAGSAGDDGSIRRAASPEFSKRLGERGWIGMSFPRAYGGHDRTALERFAVIEELLAVGAPVGAHWVADRQTGSTILLFGTEEQRQQFLPGISAGTCFFSLGMSEPDAGSDLASVRTRAERVEGGWLLNGTKIWTSGAQRSDYFVVLCRTGQAEDRHDGLSQLIVDLHSPGVTVNPIEMLDGSKDFNEVVLDNVFVPEEMTLGEPGMGWHQVTSELAFERAGPDRYMSSYGLLERFLCDWVDPTDVEAPVAQAVGELVATLWILREMSMAIAQTVGTGVIPAVEAALVKDLGTNYEREVVEVVRTAVDDEIDVSSDSAFERALAESILLSPSYTIRGGTTEVLRSVVAKKLRP